LEYELKIQIDERNADTTGRIRRETPPLGGLSLTLLKRKIK